MSKTPTTTKSKSYANLDLTREECEAIIECAPSHIRFLPPRLIDNGLAVLALRLGARPEEIPAF